jgi:hypothetical protein
MGLVEVPEPATVRTGTELERVSKNCPLLPDIIFPFLSIAVELPAFVFSGALIVLPLEDTT